MLIDSSSRETRSFRVQLSIGMLLFRSHRQSQVLFAWSTPRICVRVLALIGCSERDIRVVEYVCDAR